MTPFCANHTKMIWACKSCRQIYNKTYYIENREKYYIYERKFRYKQYGITEEEFFNLLWEQNFSCAICGVAEKDSPQETLHIDHCHETGRVRGLLCNSCNNGLGKLKDSVELLKTAINYLERNEL